MTRWAWRLFQTQSSATTRIICTTAVWGFCLGDGGLTYAREDITEWYYNAHIWRGLFGTLGRNAYIAHPGYNSDSRAGVCDYGADAHRLLTGLASQTR